jgi:DNA polymerase (family X)
MAHASPSLFRPGADAQTVTRNQEVAALLLEIAQLLELEGVPFKPRAYQRAAMNLELLGEDVAVLAQEGRLGRVPGVGDAIEEKVREFLETGRIRYLEDLRGKLAPGVLALMRVPGIGPKKALRLHQELQVASIPELKAAAEAGRIRRIKGFGQKSEEEILDAIARQAQQTTRAPYATALQAGESLVQALLAAGAVRAELAGSLRRGRDTIGDVDVLAIARPDAAPSLLDAFTKHRNVLNVIERGTTRARVVLAGGLTADLRVVGAESYGAALVYFTGSKEHNIALRTLALKKGWTVNEYALVRKSDKRRLAGATEEEVYAKLGLAWVPPELRENRGELDQAAANGLPRLVEVAHIGGDLHTHTTESDGNHRLEEMVAEAVRLGYEWYGVSDHSQGLGVARGLDPKRYAQQRKDLERLQREVDVHLLQGAEVDIHKDGRLDLDAATLAGLDYVIGSVHSHMRLPRKEQTQRILQAFDHGVDILAHPTTRLLGQRNEIEVDWEHVYEAAADRGVVLEINASPFRLDLSGERVAAARERGVALFAIDSDAHTDTGLRWMTHGVVQARRGGLEEGHVLNALPPAQLQKRLGRAKRR